VFPHVKTYSRGVGKLMNSGIEKLPFVRIWLVLYAYFKVTTSETHSDRIPKTIAFCHLAAYTYS
jgi:hypothetical protein